MCSMGTVGSLNRTGMEACRRGQFDEAEAKLLTALRIVQTRGGNCIEVKIHNNLGIVYELQGHPDKALDHYRNALELMKVKKAVKHPLHSRVIQSLARVSVLASPSGHPSFGS